MRNIFLLVLAIGLYNSRVEGFRRLLKNPSREYNLFKITDEYCNDYCANECNPKASNNKTCTKNDNHIITDKYEIFQLHGRIRISSETNFIYLTDLKKLSKSQDNVRAEAVSITPDGSLDEEQFLGTTHILRVLNLHHVNWLGRSKNVTLIEWEVDVSSGPKRAILCGIFYPDRNNQDFNMSTYFNNYMSQTMSNLKDIEVRGEGTIRFRNDTFQNNTQLEKIVFLNLNLLNLNLATFNDLTHLKELIFVNCTLDSNEFLRSITLENNLKTLDYENDQKFDVKYLESYRKLHTITLRNVDQSYYLQEFINTNVTAFLCSDYPVICYFNFGINGKRCPSSCTCSKIDHIFTINCTRQGLRKIPELPIPIIGNASLHFEGNGLTQLPNNSLEGYDGLRELHLAYNSLTHLQLDQLPFNLKVLDIRQNHLTGLDDNVTQFISTLKDVQLSENPWQCSCKYIKFLEHLRQDYPSEYVAALRRCSGQEYCPDPCTCCKEEVSQKFVTNCDKQ